MVPMDLASTFHDVVRIAQGAPDPSSGWTSLVGYLEKHGGDPLPQLAAVDLGRDVVDVRDQLVEVIESEPPGNDLNAIYFGLFDTVGDDGIEGIGYYIAGVKG